MSRFKPSSLTFVFILLLACTVEQDVQEFKKDDLNVKIDIIIDNSLGRYFENKNGLLNFVNTCINNLNGYYSTNFNISFYVSQIKSTSLDGIEISSDYFKTKNEDMTLIFKDGKGADFGHAQLRESIIYFYFTFQSEKMNSYSKLLVHEFAHLFGAIDVDDDLSVMDVDNYLDLVVPDSITVASTADNNEIVFDEGNNKLILNSRNYYKNTNGYSIFPSISDKVFLNTYKNLLKVFVNAKFKSKVSLEIGRIEHYFNNYIHSNEYLKQSLKYYELEKNSENLAIYNDVHYYNLEEAYYFIGFNYNKLNDHRLSITYLSKIEHLKSAEVYKLLSYSYFKIQNYLESLRYLKILYDSGVREKKFLNFYATSLFDQLKRTGFTDKDLTEETISIFQEAFVASTNDIIYDQTINKSCSVYLITLNISLNNIDEVENWLEYCKKNDINIISEIKNLSLNSALLNKMIQIMDGRN